MIRNPSDFEKSEPLYISLAKEIRKKISSGKLTPGERMPTVMEMCSESGLSAGTVRQAYGLLQSEGLIELTPGRGTFVSVPKAKEKSRKARALEAIDDLLHELSAMGFSPAETRMLLTLRLAQKDQEAHLTPVAAVYESPEEMRSVFDRLLDLTGIEVSFFSIEEIRSAGNVILSEFSLIVAPEKLKSEIGGILHERQDALCPIACAPSAKTVMQLAHIGSSARILIYAQTESFAKLLKKYLRSLMPDTQITLSVSGKLPADHELHLYDTLITAPDCAAFSPDTELSAMRALTESGKNVFSFELIIDDGSLLALSDRLRKLSRKTISFELGL